MISTTDVVAVAAKFAREKHAGQTRKYNGTPYWLHLARVAGLVSAYADYPPVVASAWLHDVLEDTDTSRAEIANIFSEHIADTVYSLTKRPMRGRPRWARLAAYYEQLKGAQTRWVSEGYPGFSPVVRIKLADRYDNLRELPVGDEFFQVYTRESRDLLNAIDPQREHELSQLIEAWLDNPIS